MTREENRVIFWWYIINKKSHDFSGAIRDKSAFVKFFNNYKLYSPYRLVQFVRISNIYSCCFIVNCTRNHVITNTNRPFSGADPGICGTGETNFDSENTWFLFLRLEIKNGLSTLRGEKASCHLQFIKNFSFFHLFLSTTPTVRPNCSFLVQITFVVNLF